MSNVSLLRSEVKRLARVVKEGLLSTGGFELSEFKAIATRVERSLYPLADRINETNVRRAVLDDLDRLFEAVSWGINVVEGNLDEENMLGEILADLDGVGASPDVDRLRSVVAEVARSARRQKLVEEPNLLPGDVRKLANDSVDVALDGYFRKSSETLGATGEANKEKDEGGEGEQEFSPLDFANDVANLVDRVNTLLDLDGTIGRRAFNYVSEKYGPDAADNFKQVLSANFDVDLESPRDMEGERFADRPAAIGAGVSGAGGAIGGGGGGGEGGGPP